jgi:ribosomal-protein-alanine acetyltransferase
MAAGSEPRQQDSRKRREEVVDVTPVCSIRLARRDDAVHIALMSRDFIESGLGWRWTPARIVACLRDRAMNVVVAEYGKRIVGFGIMQYRELEAHLMLFGILPQARRRGIGTVLLRWLEKVALNAGIELVFLEARCSNAAAREFYRMQGYRELALLKRYYAGTEDAVRIGRDLTAAPQAVPPRGSQHADD